MVDPTRGPGAPGEHACGGSEADASHGRAGGRRADEGERTGADAPGGDAADDSWARVVESLLAHLRELREPLLDVARIERARLREMLVLGARRVLVGTLLLLAVVVAVVLAVRHLLQGLADAIAAVTGVAWLGPLGAGALFLGALFGGIALAGKRRNGRAIERLEEELGPPPAPPGPANGASEPGRERA